jgi:hypothetical protein
MNIDRKDWDIWDNTTFKTTSYHKNFDLVNDDESIITEYSGTISLIRLADYLPPLLMGEFELSTWNIALGKNFDADFMKLIKSHKIENTYGELVKVIKNKELNVENYNKIVFVPNLVLRPDFRKRGITEEFIELLYREFYGENNAIIALVKPLQDNPIDADVYYNQKFVEVHQSLQNYHDILVVPSVKYYSLDELLQKKDTEINEYKLFSVASRCGFTRLGESHLFILSPEKTVQRIKEKQEYGKKLNTKTHVKE